MEKLQLQLIDKNRMVEEIVERCPPGFTGEIELFGDMVHKAVDRYYAWASFKDGKPHNLTKEAIYVNYKDFQEYHFVVEGKEIAYYYYNIFDTYETGEVTDDGCILVGQNYIADRRIRITDNRFVRTRIDPSDGSEWIEYMKAGKILSVPNIKKMIVRTPDAIEDLVFEIEHNNLVVN